MIKTSKIVLTTLIFGYAFLYIPLVFLVITSFSASEVPGIWTHFSLKWFFAVFEDDSLLQALLNSLEIASISATVSVLLGVLAAVATTRSESFFGKKFLSGFIMIPVIMPEIIVGFSLLMLFVALEGSFGFPKDRGIMTVVIGHITATMAYVHITIRARLLTFDSSIEEAAANLGAKPFSVFIRIKIPIISKSIIAGWLLAFTLSLDDLVIASFLAGPGSTTLPILIFSNIRIGITPVVNAFAAMFMLVVFICITMTHFLTKSSPKIKKSRPTKYIQNKK